MFLMYRLQRLEGRDIALQPDPQNARGFAPAEAAGLAEIHCSLPTTRCSHRADAAQDIQPLFGLLAQKRQGDVHQRRIGPAIVATRVVWVEPAQSRLDFARQLDSEKEAHFNLSGSLYLWERAGGEGWFVAGGHPTRSFLAV